MEFFRESALKTTLAALFFLSACIMTAICVGYALPEGSRRELYLYKSSSACETVTADDSTIFLRKNISGESVCLQNERELNDFLSSVLAVRVFAEHGEDFDCVYYYSPRLRFRTAINGRRVNIAVMRSKNGIKIATPFPFGSF